MQSSNAPAPRRLDGPGRQMLAFWALLVVTVGGSAAVTYFGFETLSAVRAYVGGEGLWSKAQKDATYRLVRYARSGDSVEYRLFRQLLDVQLGDRQARLELERVRPDYRVVRQGFLRGRIHPQDVNGLSSFFRRFRHVSYVSDAIDIWAAGDSGIAELSALGDSIHSQVTLARPDRARIEGLLVGVDRVEARLAQLEDRFSATLGAGARWARSVVWSVILGTAALLIAVGATLSWRLARHARVAETTRRALEGQLRQAQKMEAIGQLTGGIAHDFNNLLTIILSNVELVKSDLGPEEAAPDLAEIEAAARKGAAMVRKLLAFSRTGQLELGPIGLARLVGDLSEMLRRLLPETIRVRVTAAPDAPPVLADPGAVEQILLNLATNARDAMPHGGTLDIVVEPRVLDEAFRGAMGDGRAGEFACLSVSDTGTGMDQAVVEHLFEPFFTTKPPGVGTGLGMAMVYGLVRQHGGLVDVDTAPGRGTTVRIYFPAATRAEGALARPRSTPPPGVRAGGSEMILLVEDEIGIRRVAQRALERAGYRVLSAEDGVEALDVVRAHAGEIRLVVSDVVMPRCGGPELREAVLRAGHSVPFLFMSGYTARDAGSTEKLDPDLPVLHKPWSVADLLSRVRQMLDATRGISAA